MTDQNRKNLHAGANRGGKAFLDWFHTLTLLGYEETPAIIFKSVHNGFIEQCFINGGTPAATLKKYKAKFITP